MMPLTVEDFNNDPQGNRCKDVMNCQDYDFPAMLGFMNDEARQQRMFVAQEHFDAPALGGIVKELEASPVFGYLHTADKHKTVRLRQAIGVAVKVLMQKMGWKKTGTKGSLAHLSKCFRLSEIYSPK